MSKAEPTIQKYMTDQPQVIEGQKALDEAIHFMEQQQIRHLPVVDSGKLVGVLSDRDIKLAKGIIDFNEKVVRVCDIAQRNPYQVSPDTSLTDVLDEMAEKHYGSCLIVQNEKLVGIFTTIDVCKAFSEVLQQRYHEKK